LQFFKRYRFSIPDSEPDNELGLL
jgi:hypothetical protein